MCIAISYQVTPDMITSTFACTGYLNQGQKRLTPAEREKGMVADTPSSRTWMVMGWGWMVLAGSRMGHQDTRGLGSWQ